MLYSKFAKRRWVRLGAKAALGVFVLASIATAALNMSHQSGVSVGLGSWHFVFAAVVAIVYRAVNPIGWVAVLHGLGCRVKPVAGISVWLGAEAHRWLPGGFWGYASRAVQAKKMGVPMLLASTSMIIELLLTITAAILVSLFGMLLYFGHMKESVAELLAKDVIHWPAVLLAICTLLGLFGIGYVLREKLFHKLKSLNETWQLLHLVEISYRKLTWALLYFVAMAGLNGIVNLVMMRCCSDADVPVIVMIAATSAAWVVGYLAFFSPGGLFVREAVLAMLLLPWMPYSTALTIAVLSRLAQLLAEVVCMVIPILGLQPNEPEQENVIEGPVPQFIDRSNDPALSNSPINVLPTTDESEKRSPSPQSTDRPRFSAILSYPSSVA